MEYRTVKAVYYPQLQLQMCYTKKGRALLVGDNPYERPIKGKYIFKVDVLKALTPYFGEDFYLDSTFRDKVSDMLFMDIDGKCRQALADLTKDNLYFLRYMRVETAGSKVYDTDSLLEELHNKVKVYESSLETGLPKGYRKLIRSDNFVYIARSDLKDALSSKLFAYTIIKEE